MRIRGALVSISFVAFLAALAAFFRARLIFAVKGIDILYKLSIQKMQRYMLGANARTLTAIRAASGDVKRTDYMKHFFFERICGCFVFNT